MPFSKQPTVSDTNILVVIYKADYDTSTNPTTLTVTFWLHICTLNCQLPQIHCTRLPHTTDCMGCSCCGSERITCCIKLNDKRTPVRIGCKQTHSKGHFPLDVGTKRIESRLTGEVSILLGAVLFQSKGVERGQTV